MSTVFIRLNFPGPAAGTRVPLVERLMARATPSPVAGDWRAVAYGDVAPQAPIPDIAPVALAAEPDLATGTPAAGPAVQTVLLATPVFCEAGMVSVRMALDGVLRLSAGEAARLAADFSRDFGTAGHRLVAGARGSLYVLMEDEVRVATADPAAVAGRDIGAFLPSGPDGAALRRLQTELEMWLFAHPLNTARKASGQRPVSGLWLWGAGAPLTRLPAAPGWTAGEDVLFGAWPAETRFPQRGCAGVVVIDALPGEAGWDATERDWLEPAVAALRAGRIRRLTLSVAAQRFELSAVTIWRGWRRPRPWWEWLE